MPLFFACRQTAGAVFVLTDHLMVLHVGAFEGAVAEASGFWADHPIHVLVLADDVAEWLMARP